ncbi:MAG: helix-turn-helix domain-containing protein [Cyclobacteriaceae bacterium]
MGFLSILLLFGVFQGVLLAAGLSLNGKSQRVSHIFLITLLLVCSGFLFYQYLVFERIPEQNPHLIGIYLPVLYLLPPLFWFYVKSETLRQNEFEWKSFYHGIPFLLTLAVMLPFYLSPAEEKLATLFSHRSVGELYPFRNQLIIGIWISGVVYGIKSIRLAHQHTPGKRNWIKTFIHTYLVLNIGFPVVMVLVYFEVHRHREIMIVASTLFSFFIHFIGFAALRKSTLFSVRKNSSIRRMDQEERTKLKGRVETLLEEGAYRRNDFSIQELSDQLSINSNYLSAIINDEFNCSFTFLVNSHRIREAEKMITSDQFAHLNFLGIATEVGFNNKNSFTRAFKRHKGVTPSEFRRKSDRL